MISLNGHNRGHNNYNRLNMHATLNFSKYLVQNRNNNIINLLLEESGEKKIENVKGIQTIKL